MRRLAASSAAVTASPSGLPCCAGTRPALAWDRRSGQPASAVRCASKGFGCKQARTIRTRAPDQQLRALTSRSHLDAQTIALLDSMPSNARIACGSSLKLCKIAEGEAEFSPTHEWDVAAGHSIHATLNLSSPLAASFAGSNAPRHVFQGLQLSCVLYVLERSLQHRPFRRRNLARARRPKTEMDSKADQEEDPAQAQNSAH